MEIWKYITGLSGIPDDQYMISNYGNVKFIKEVKSCGFNENAVGNCVRGITNTSQGYRWEAV